jgi:hypothetical protein
VFDFINQIDKSLFINPRVHGEFDFRANVNLAKVFLKLDEHIKYIRDIWV